MHSPHHPKFITLNEADGPTNRLYSLLTIHCLYDPCPKAKSISVFSSISCALADPVAGLALAVRFTLSKALSPTTRFNSGIT